MKPQSFSSFKELLIKKDLADDGDQQKSIRYDVLGRIFRFIPSNLIQSNIKHFDDASKKIIHKVFDLPALQEDNSKLSNGEFEALIRDSLQNLSDAKKLLLIDLLEKDAFTYQKENKKIEFLANKYQPKDPKEALDDLSERIEDLKQSIIDIECNLMTMEKDQQETSKHYKKSADARERRKQLLAKLEKQKLGLEKKIKSNTKKSS